MSNSFAQIVEQVRSLSSLEKQELRKLIDRYLVEERREEIYDSFVQSRKELEDGKLVFSSDLDVLKGMLAGD